jgi:hypothetical protein
MPVGKDWHIHDTGRCQPPDESHPDGYSHFMLSSNDEFASEYPKGIETDIPGRWTHCSVRVSREWMSRPDLAG